MYTQSMQITIKRLETLFLEIISHENACIFHQLSDVSCFPTRCCGHIDYSLIRLRSESDYREERRSGLEDIVSS